MLITKFLTKTVVICLIAISVNADVVYEQNQFLAHSTTQRTLQDIVVANWNNCAQEHRNQCRVHVRNGWHASNAYPEEHVTFDIYPNGYQQNYIRRHYNGNGNLL